MDNDSGAIMAQIKQEEEKFQTANNNDVEASLLTYMKKNIDWLREQHLEALQQEGKVLKISEI